MGIFSFLERNAIVIAGSITERFTMNRQPYHKQYIDVVILHKTDGSVEIQEIIWPDGRRFRVQKTEALGYAAGKHTGAPGKAYAVWIGHRKRIIYCQKNRYFVEVPGALHKEDTFEIPEEDLEWMNMTDKGE